jgi:dihydroorotate dehydrogenase (fumarate)
MVDTTTQYLGLTLRTPIVASPSPLTGSIADLVALEQAGVGAVVLPSLFEEELVAESLTLYERHEQGAFTNPEATDYFPDLAYSHLGLDRHITLLRDAVQELAVPVIGSINGRTPGGWVEYAQTMADAGAAAVELNMYDVVADPSRTAGDVEAEYITLVTEVVDAVDVPVSVKLSPYFTSIANFARHVVDAGAQGLVLFNRFYQPDLDLQTLDVTPRLELSHPSEMRLPLRWIAILRPQLPHTSLALTSGVHSGQDVLKALLAGSDAVMTTTAVLNHGPGIVRTMVDDIQAWLTDKEYDSVTQLQGSMAQHATSDPGAYERAQYQQVLASWRPVS